MVAAPYRPVCAPPGTTDVFRGFGPVVPCRECGGVPADLDVEPPCRRCREVGWEPDVFALPRTRAFLIRRVVWDMARWRLVLKRAAKPRHKGEVALYSVSPLPCDWLGLAFLVVKDTAEGEDPRQHEVYVGPDRVTCSCEAAEYLTSAKHNQRAYEEGDETYPTHGCIHADALAALVAAGWFDLSPRG